MTTPRKKLPAQHQHNFKISTYGTDVTTYRCHECDARLSLPNEPEQKKAYLAYSKESSKTTDALHKTWRAFCKKFKEADNETYRYDNDDLMNQIEKWAKGRKDVHLLHVDDAWFTNSLLVLIEHGASNAWMGLTALMISQRAPSPPVEFFLYPRDAHALFKTLSNKRYRSADPFMLTKSLTYPTMRKLAAKRLRTHLKSEKK